MTKVLLIFDYLKEAFEVNRKNKLLYRPQVLLAVLKALTVLSVGMLIYFYVRGMLGRDLSLDDYSFSSLISAFLVIIIASILFWVVSAVFQSGLYYMYDRSVRTGETKASDFSYGIRQYLLKFLAVDLLTLFAWIVFSPVYLIIGLITLFSGFAIVPVVVSIFLGMWKVSIISNECSIFTALKNSLRFAGKFFAAYSVFMLIVFAFTNPVQKAEGIRIVTNLASTIIESIKDEKLTTPDNPYLIPNFEPDSRLNYQFDTYTDSPAYKYPYTDTYDKYSQDLDLTPYKALPDIKNSITENMNSYLRVVGILFITGAAVLSIGTFLSSLIRMIFEVFFGLAMFVVYKNKFQIIAPEQSEEVPK